MNIPSTSQGNWGWRLKKNYAKTPLINKITKLTKENGRFAE
jgi:4-alpha-glucanotransferase